MSTTTTHLDRPTDRPDAPNGPPSWLVLVGFVVVAQAAGLIGIPFTERGAWYQALDKPSFNPPSAVFAPVWTTLYVLIGIAGWRVWRTRPSDARRRALQLWVVQLVLNAVWSPLFFGAHQPTWALVEICVLWVAIVLTAVAAWRVDRPAGVLLAPYLAWVTFATTLNAGFVVLN